MDMSDLVAQRNMVWLGENPYPGRGIVIGMDETGRNMVQVYWIMGRSPNSRNRVLSYDERGRLFTEPADPAQMKDPSLIIYNAMQEDRDKGVYVVSNGDQTDSVFLQHSFVDAMFSREYEPDAPNFTQRITGQCWIDDCRGAIYFALAILRKARWAAGCDRHLYYYEDVAPGFGYCITTYSGDGNPLPPFIGDPLLMPLKGDIGNIAIDYWQALGEDNRVSLAVKFISVATGQSQFRVMNRFDKVG